MTIQKDDESKTPGHVQRLDFPHKASHSSELAYFCVEAAMALHAVQGMLDAIGNSDTGCLSFDDLACLLRFIESPLEAASTELHSRMMGSDLQTLNRDFHKREFERQRHVTNPK